MQTNRDLCTFQNKRGKKTCDLSACLPALHTVASPLPLPLPLPLDRDYPRYCVTRKRNLADNGCNSAPLIASLAFSHSSASYGSSLCTVRACTLYMLWERP